MGSLRTLALIEILLTPGCWMQNYPYSRAWDEELTWLLDHGFRFELKRNPLLNRAHRAQIADYDVWIENHPYASFTIDGVRPSRATILRAGHLVNAARDSSSQFPSDRRYRETPSGAPNHLSPSTR